MDTSAKTLNLQSSLKASKVEEIIYYDYHQNNITWSSLPSTPFTTTLGESLISNVNKKSSLYNLWWVGDLKFEVEFVGDEIGDENEYDLEVNDILDAPIPYFCCIHIVTIGPDGTLYCLCCGFESAGVYCEHKKSCRCCLQGTWSRSLWSLSQWCCHSIQLCLYASCLKKINIQTFEWYLPSSCKNWCQRSATFLAYSRHYSNQERDSYVDYSSVVEKLWSKLNSNWW